MTPEEFDKKARDANNYTVPPFEEQDWNKMEFLLNRHLPQKKNKKRIFFWWFAALVPVVLTGLMLFNNYNPHNSEKSSFKKDLIKEKNDNVTSNQQPNEQQELNILKADAANNEKFNTDETSKKTDEETADNFNKQHKQKLVFGNSSNNIFFKNDNQISTVNKNDETVYKNDTYKNDITNASEPNVAIAITQKETVDQKEKIAASLSDTLIDKDKNKTKSRSEPVAKKRAAKNNFYFTLTSGLESSGTGINNLGAVKPVYGAGLQYSSGKLFVRTGVLVTKKIYAAKDKDYNRKAGTWMSNVKFDNINANCKVVEVPLTVGYQISSNKKTNVYVAVGSSSYFMKKEDYQFYFKGQTGNDTTRAASFKNNSNHYFSSISFSAGIEQKVTRKLSITAEPQIKIPVSGIGFGKIKLYGIGMLLSAKIKLK